MRSKQKGIVLFTTIILLTLVALLTLSQLQMAFLYYHALNQAVEKHQFFYQLEAQANRLLLDKHWLAQGACIIKERNPNEVIELLKNKQGCVLSHYKQQFFYLVEDIGLFPCLQVQDDKVTYSTQHWRINMMTNEKYPGFLQLRFARLAKLATCENSKPRQIKVGLLSWCYLSGQF
jgi:hypothetical protein